MQFIYEDRTPGLEHAKDFNKVYSVIKRRSKRRGISMKVKDFLLNYDILINKMSTEEIIFSMDTYYFIIL